MKKSIVILVLITHFGYAQSAQMNKSKIAEAQYITINGIEQWFTIKGNPDKPLLLFLHGGPGSVLSPYADKLLKDWEDDFMIAQWDQRGAGRTFGKLLDEELTLEYIKSNPLTLEQMAADGIAVSTYLTQRFGKQKIILIGTSWGSALGITMVSKRPDLYYAYIGHSQITAPTIDKALYEKVYQKSKKNNDLNTLEILNSIGAPPYESAKTVGKFIKIVKKFERENSIAAPDSWFVTAAEYQNEKDEMNRENGDDYSFINYVGDKANGIPSISASIDFLKTNIDFKIPLYFIQGEEDLLTPKENSKLYFDSLHAPSKEYILLPQTAHGFNQAVLNALFKVAKNIKI